MVRQKSCIFAALVLSATGMPPASAVAKTFPVPPRAALLTALRLHRHHPMVNGLMQWQRSSSSAAPGRVDLNTHEPRIASLALRDALPQSAYRTDAETRCRDAAPGAAHERAAKARGRCADGRLAVRPVVSGMDAQGARHAVIIAEL